MLNHIARIDGVISADLTPAGLVIVVNAASWADQYCFRMIARPGATERPWQIRAQVRINDAALLDTVRLALNAYAPSTYVELETVSSVIDGDLATVTIRTTVKRRTPYRIVRCERCSGSGEHSYNHDDGSVCFKCGGIGWHGVNVPTLGASTVRVHFVDYVRDGNRVTRIGDGAVGTLIEHEDTYSVEMDDDTNTVRTSCPSATEISR
jgi:hypothetical protein